MKETSTSAALTVFVTLKSDSMMQKLVSRILSLLVLLFDEHMLTLDPRFNTVFL